MAVRIETARLVVTDVESSRAPAAHPGDTFDHTARLWDLEAADPAARPIVLEGPTEGPVTDAWP